MGAAVALYYGSAPWLDCLRHLETTAIAHYPFLLLIGATFLLALVYTTLYFRGRNLLALGIYHGWLATFFFYWVLGRDSWLEAFG